MKLPVASLEGNFIISWQNETVGKFFSLVIDHKNDRLLGIASQPSNDSNKIGSTIYRFDLDLNLELQFGRTGFYDGQVSKYHDIVIDKEGNIFVADLNNNTIQKFRLIKAD